MIINTWFTSDTHFNHFNIIKYCNRPFSSVEEMNETIVEKWNKVVKPQDEVYHLGDVGFGPFDYSRLNGQKHLLLGNHDHKTKGLEVDFNILSGDIFILKGKEIVLCHYPILAWPHKYRGWLHLHGHSHGKVKGYSKNAIDVGVDCWDFTPIHLDELNKLRVDKYKL